MQIERPATLVRRIGWLILGPGPWVKVQPSARSELFSWASSVAGSVDTQTSDPDADPLQDRPDERGSCRSRAAGGQRVSAAVMS